MLFRDATLVLPDRVVPHSSLRTSAGRITTVAPAADLSPIADEVSVDANGAFLAPGFIDLHVHGALGRDTMEATPDAFRAILDYHLRGGTVAAALTTTAAPEPDILRVLDTALVFRQTDSRLLGIHIEGPFLSPTRPGAHRPEFIRDPADAEVRHLFDYADTITQLTLAPERPGALDLIARCNAAGIIASGGHSEAWDDEAAAAHAAGMSRVTHLFNAMSSARRQGPSRVAGLTEFALATPSVRCELIADGAHVSPTLLRLAYRAKGVDGLCLITDATAGAGLPDGATYPLAGQTARVHGNAGVTVDGAALAGSTSTMLDCLRHFTEMTGVPMHETVRMATLNPARALRCEDERGQLAPGLRADLVLLSPSLEILGTWVNGVRLHPLERS